MTYIQQERVENLESADCAVLQLYGPAHAPRAIPCTQGATFLTRGFICMAPRNPLNNTLNSIFLDVLKLDY